MKASEYMKLIQDSIDKYGDLPVVVKTTYEHANDLYEESVVSFEQESVAHGERYNSEYKKVDYFKAFVVYTNNGEY